MNNIFTRTAIDGKTGYFSAGIYNWDSNNSMPVVLAERDGLSNPLSSCAYDGFSPLLFKAAEPGNQSFSTAENRYCLNDHLSSILALSNEEAIITDQYDYDEYGIPVIKKADSRNNYGYTGQDYDERTGLLYLRARYYEPVIGLFLGADPLYLNYSFNYSHNSPVVFIDVSGEWAYAIAFCAGASATLALGLPATSWYGCHRGCLGLKVSNFTDPEKADKAIWDEFVNCPEKYQNQFNSMHKNQYTDCVTNCLNDAAIQNNQIKNYGIGFTTILAICGPWVHPTTGGLR